ncbi:MAG: hypothetical protein ACO1RX_04170 [Candidatus Sericytochromatia bacterium]
MSRFLGVALFLALTALLQLVWPLPLPGLDTGPALLLLTAGLLLAQLPEWRLYTWAVLLAAGMDLLFGEALWGAAAHALALLLPLLWPPRGETPALWRVWGRLLPLLGIFEIVLAVAGALRGSGAGLQLFSRLLPFYAWNLLAALPLLLLTRGLIQALHYQRFEYLDEVKKGRLG